MWTDIHIPWTTSLFHVHLVSYFVNGSYHVKCVSYCILSYYMCILSYVHICVSYHMTAVNFTWTVAHIIWTTSSVSWTAGFITWNGFPKREFVCRALVNDLIACIGFLWIRKRSTCDFLRSGYRKVARVYPFEVGGRDPTGVAQFDEVYPWGSGQCNDTSMTWAHD